MALPDMRIDDRSYDELLDVLRRQIPTDYTDHNPSDPLITLLELFCWLGEISLYRMDRITSEHEARYLALLADPPVPVTVPVVFTATYGGGGAHTMHIPAGTRVATDFTNGRRSVFETLEPATIADTDPIENSVRSHAREFLEVTDEILGVAEGLPGESFTLTPIHARLGIGADATAPVLFDDAHRSDEYDPNPQIRTWRGIMNGTGGLVSPANGVLTIDFDAAPLEAHFFLTFSPPDLRLTRGDGTIEDAAVSTAVIPPGEVEEVRFPGFGATVGIGPAFDKSTGFGLLPSSVAIGGGSAIVDPASVSVVSTRGSVDRISGTALTVASLDDPTALAIILNDGYTGSFDGSSTGPKVVELTGPDGDRITIGFDVTQAFDGTETSAVITLGSLENLVVFGNERWVAYHSLRTERSAVGSFPGRPRHVMVRPLERTVHFGDGEYGAIPAAGSLVSCERYQLVLGPPNLVNAGSIVNLLTPIPDLAVGDAISVFNENDAFGGEHFFSTQTRVSAGLDAFRKPYRLVTADDFERALLGDFNDYQEKIANRVERIARASAIMNRRPPALDEDAPGHVTVMVARRLSAPEQALWDDPAVPLATKQTMLGLATADPLDPLRRRILTFLEERRLITTHVRVVAPTLVGVQFDLSVVVDVNRNATEMQNAVRDAVASYLSLVDGGRDGRGWPIGRYVYRSEILALVEGLVGVDYVPSLSLTPADADGDFAVGPNELPVITALTVVALRQ